MPVATYAQAGTSSWVQLGAASGPMLLQATNEAVLFAFAAGAPAAAAPGFSLKPGDVFSYTGAQNVYIRLRPVVAENGVTPGGSAIYSV